MKKILFILALLPFKLYAATADLNFTWEYPGDYTQIETKINCSVNSLPIPEETSQLGALSHKITIPVTGGEQISCTAYGLRGGMPSPVSSVVNISIPSAPSVPINFKGIVQIIFQAILQ